MRPKTNHSISRMCKAQTAVQRAALRQPKSCDLTTQPEMRRRQSEWLPCGNPKAVTRRPSRRCADGSPKGCPAAALLYACIFLPKVFTSIPSPDPDIRR